MFQPVERHGSEEFSEFSDTTIRLRSLWRWRFSRVHPEDRAFVEQTIGRASRDGTDADYEHRLFDAGWPQSSMSMLLLVRSQIQLNSWEFHRGHYGCYSDPKRAEDELRKTQTELAHVTRVTMLGELRPPSPTK